MNQSYREVLKRRLVCNDAGEVDYLTFDARCIRKFGPAAGTFLRQLVYWVGKQHDREGWIHKTQYEMEQETGLSRHFEEKARNILVSQGVLKERKKGVPRKLWYWVDLEALLEVMETPYSTLNQWARKQKNNAAESTKIREGVSQDHTTEHANEIDSTARASRKGSIHLASADDSSALDSEAYRAYKSHREGNLSLQDLASEVCLVLTGSHDQTDAYVEPVRRMVEELAIDDAVSH